MGTDQGPSGSQNLTLPTQEPQAPQFLMPTIKAQSTGMVAEAPHCLACTPEFR